MRARRLVALAAVGLLSFGAAACTTDDADIPLEDSEVPGEPLDEENESPTGESPPP